jgi:UDP-N-acetyl-D-glucosamine dehydrogenase
MPQSQGFHSIPEPPAEGSLAEKLAAKKAVVGVMGLGYVGLPLAKAFSAAQIRVVGFDTDPSKIERLNAGESYIRQITAQAVQEMRSSGFEATGDMGRLSEPDAILICVPTPLTESRDPDLTFVTRSTEAIARALRPHQLVVLESTTYPTTTRTVLVPLLEQSGLRAGADFYLAFSPEREDPGNPLHSVGSIPKVVGGFDPVSAELTCALYRHIVPAVVRVSSLEVAEACKILENTYRAVNIALVNELKTLYDRMGIDVWEVIDAAKTKPFGFQAFYPGPGLGGHCIPIDPFYLSWIARQYGHTTRFIELAGEINTAMPAYVVGRIAAALQQRGGALAGSRIALLGMAYKRDVDDPRESPGFELLAQLSDAGASVSYSDPYIPQLPAMRRYPGLKMTSQKLSEKFLHDQDCVVIVTDHSLFDYAWIVERSRLVVDTRNATRDVKSGREKIVKA